MAPLLAEMGAVTVGALDPKGTLAVPELKARPTNAGVVIAFCVEILVILTPSAGAICRPRKLISIIELAILRQRI
jgi:hypothetical protein